MYYLLINSINNSGINSFYLFENKLIVLIVFVLLWQATKIGTENHDILLLLKLITEIFFIVKTLIVNIILCLIFFYHMTASLILHFLFILTGSQYHHTCSQTRWQLCCKSKLSHCHSYLFTLSVKDYEIYKMFYFNLT